METPAELLKERYGNHPGLLRPPPQGFRQLLRPLGRTGRQGPLLHTGRHHGIWNEKTTRRAFAYNGAGVVFLCSLFDRDSRELLVLAAALSVLLAQDQDEETVGRMAAFFTIVGDTLALFALQPNLFRNCRSLCSPASEGEKEAEPEGTGLSGQKSL